MLEDAVTSITHHFHASAISGAAVKMTRAARIIKKCALRPMGMNFRVSRMKFFKIYL